MESKSGILDFFIYIWPSKALRATARVSRSPVMACYLPIHPCHCYSHYSWHVCHPGQMANRPLPRTTFNLFSLSFSSPSSWKRSSEPFSLLCFKFSTERTLTFSLFPLKIQCPTAREDKIKQTLMKASSSTWHLTSLLLVIFTTNSVHRAKSLKAGQSRILPMFCQYFTSFRAYGEDFSQWRCCL